MGTRIGTANIKVSTRNASQKEKTGLGDRSTHTAPSAGEIGPRKEHDITKR